MTKMRRSSRSSSTDLLVRARRLQRCRLAVSWASEAQFELDLAAGAIPEGVAAVMYDPERWAHTPDPEQRDPVAAIEAFAVRGRAAGYR